MQELLRKRRVRFHQNVKDSNRLSYTLRGIDRRKAIDLNQRIQGDIFDINVDISPNQGRDLWEKWRE
ncbi:hypothetical protein [Mesorhizobium neociceri]|uniref:Uncharacterized protein n=1 Tax=Mesorhizobium neociceri TaxID=1307853 RepID=A0A838B4C7_9HYPH|nr:hypothetical protein [Mesorhizobium neociceri]MBA1140624.1 hypothetical protein [Mesorhizobium neociceri]